MKTHDSIKHDLRDRYLAKVNALIADDREDLISEIVAEYVELTADRAQPSAA